MGKLLYLLLVLSLVCSCYSIQNYQMALNFEQKYTFNNSTCFEIKINNMYQNIDITIEAKNISKFLITNSKLDNSQSNEFIPKCSADSQLCLEYINTSKTEYLSNYCSKQIFIYGCSENLESSLEEVKESSISVKNVINKLKGCSPIQRTLWSDCASLGSNCDNIDLCSKKCESLTCSKEDKEYKICSPVLTNQQRKDVCSSLLTESTVTFSSCNPSIINKIDVVNADGNPSDNRFLKLLTILIGVMIFGIIMSSFYYRIKLKEHGVPPFEPPVYMPGFIYPRPQKEGQFITK